MYRKTTFSGVLTNYFSFTAMRYKIGLIRCLIDRVYKINNTSKGFNEDLKKVFYILKRNCYLEYIINKVSKNYLDRKSMVTTDTPGEEESKLSYFKLPYIGKSSTAMSSRIKNICQKYCNNVDVRLVFLSFKLSNMFSTKDKLLLKSHVVYKFKCARCNSCYIGYTTRHFTTRIHEHLTDKQSHIYQHLNGNIECKSLSDKSCFSIIDNANTEYDLKIKEALHIQWLKPTINKQMKSMKMTLSV